VRLGLLQQGDFFWTYHCRAAVKHDDSDKPWNIKEPVMLGRREKNEDIGWNQRLFHPPGTI
jgi:hypothetical protein